MGRRVRIRTMVTLENGAQQFFEPGEQVPDELVGRITNPLVWERPQPSDAVPTGGASGADAPYASHVSSVVPEQPSAGGEVSSPDDTSQERSAPLPARSDPLPERSDTETEQTEVTGESSVPARGDGPTWPLPGVLDEMTRAELLAVAASHHVAVRAGAPKSEVRRLIDSARERAEAD